MLLVIGGPSAGLAFSLSGCQQTTETDKAKPTSKLSAPDPKPDRVSVNLETTVLDETSGMVASRLNEHRLWLHNDSGDDPILYAVNSQTGRLEHSLYLQGAKARDWEDISAYQYADEAWLLVGDIGDNLAIRRKLTLYGLREPTGAESEAETVWKISFQYEDGARDCEALAVDTAEQAIYLLSKRDQPPRLYRLPLQASEKTETAVFVTEVSTIPQPTSEDFEEDPLFGQLRAWPTAMDISSDNLQLLITTYKDAYLYRRKADESWADALSRNPRVIDLPQMAQTEAGAFSYDGKGVWASSEQLPTPIVFTPIPATGGTQP